MAGKGWGLGIRTDLTWFPTIRFRSLRDSLYPGEHLSFQGAVGALCLSHCLDLGCRCLFRRAPGLSLSGLLDAQIWGFQLPFMKED